MGLSQVVKMHARKEMLHAPACPGRERSSALGFAGCERGLSAAFSSAALPEVPPFGEPQDT